MKEKLISRSDIKFWLVIGAVFAGFLTWGGEVKSDVRDVRNDLESLSEESHDKGAKLREEFENDHELLKSINDRTIRIETNQNNILKLLDSQ